MRIITTLATGLGLALLAAPALAGNDMPRLYPYPTTENYCPAGLQPIVYNGEISCGAPNTTMTYRQMAQHPAQTRRARGYSARPSYCPVGSKGCS